jgi:NAD(P)-dependent dehydrogenase (short-subunit alcohol dehydrogenase family)
MKPRRSGAIVITSSLAAFVAWPSVAPYVASKGGLNALVRAIALDVGAYGIRANAICPSQGMSPNFLLPGDAPVVGRSYQEAADAPWDPMATAVPLKLKRPPSLRDNANAALFLASDDSEYMSGVCIPTCDGGQLARVANLMAPAPL